MGVGNLRPNAVVSPDTSVVTPSGSAADVTNDSPVDDTSYFSKNAGDNWTIVEFDSTALATDSMVKLIQPRLRMRSDSGGTSQGEIQLRTSGTVLSTTPFSVGTTFVEQNALSTARPFMTQAEVDALRLAVRVTSGEVQFSELYIDLTYAEQPTTTANGPTGTQTTSVVTGEWQHTAGTDGGIQAAWAWKIYSAAQYQSPNFDPDVTTPVMYRAAETTVTSYDSIALQHDTDYRSYVATAQRVGGVLHWADWDFTSFVVDLVAPEVDAITVTVDPAFARVVIDVDRDTGGDPWDHVEVQRLSKPNLISDSAATLTTDADANGRADAWDSDTTGTVSTTFSITGGYQRVAVTGVSVSERQTLQLGELLAVAAGGDYTAAVTAKAPTMGANTALALGIRWFDAGGTLLSTDETVLDSTEVTTAAASYTMTAQAPALAAYAAPMIAVVGLTGASGASTTGDFKNFSFVEGDDEDAWVDVVGASDTTPGADTVSILDYGIPGDTLSLYRARAVDSNGNAGRWLYSTSPVEWEQSGSWIKSPNRPGFNTQFCLAVRPEFDWPRRQGIHEVIDDPSPVTVSGPRMLRRGKIEIETETRAEYEAIMAVLEDSLVLFQFDPTYGVDQLWASIGNINETIAEEKTLTLQYRTLLVDVVELSTTAVGVSV